MYIAKEPSTFRVTGTQCKLSSSTENRVIVNIPIMKYMKTISVRVNPLGTRANTINTNQANKARTARDIVITFIVELTDMRIIPKSDNKIKESSLQTSNFVKKADLNRIFTFL